jgi:hypothetical protein
MHAEVVVAFDAAIAALERCSFISSQA